MQPDESRTAAIPPHDVRSATDRQVARAAIRVILRRLGIKGEAELRDEIAKVVAEETKSNG